MKLIHYGSYFYTPGLIRPIRNRATINKPLGGLWASPIDAEFGWKDWLLAEDWETERLNWWFEFEIDTTNMYMIDCYADLKALICESRGTIDFELISKSIDAIYLTAKGMERTRMNPRGGIEGSLYGWDCECVLIMNPAIIQST